MTRINLVDPAVLTSKHLMAEYRELPRVFTAVAKDPVGSVTRPKPPQYTLGTGHVVFFYDKLGWLLARYKTLYAELVARGYALDKSAYNSIKAKAFTLMLTDLMRLNTAYDPTPAEIYLNMARLARRSNISSVLKELANDD